MDIEDVINKMDFMKSILSEDGQHKLRDIIKLNEEVFLPNTDGKISFTPYLQHKIHLVEDKVIHVPGLCIPHA